MKRSRVLSLLGASIAGLAAIGDVAASGGAAGTLPTVPQWAVYVGLTVMCPEELNDLVIGSLRKRFGLDPRGR